MAKPEWIAIITVGALRRRSSTTIPVSSAVLTNRHGGTERPRSRTSGWSAQNHQQNGKSYRPDAAMDESSGDRRPE